MTVARNAVSYRPSRGKGGTQAALEDYVEVINHLIKKYGYASQTDVAERLGVSKPSVTLMLQRLKNKGYVEYVKYRGIGLTQKGRRLAERMEERHKMLAEFFLLIGVDEHIAYEDAELIEHYLHPITLQKISELLDKLKKKNLK
ncbi:MAG: iron dependent repressor, metal binding and dimerization domain protein [Conexivisphaerales archaeon]